MGRQREALDEQTMSQAAIGHGERIVPEFDQYRVHDARSRENDVGSFGLEADKPASSAKAATGG